MLAAPVAVAGPRCSRGSSRSAPTVRPGGSGGASTVGGNDASTGAAIISDRGIDARKSVEVDIPENAFRTFSVTLGTKTKTHASSVAIPKMPPARNAGVHKSGRGAACCGGSGIHSGSSASRCRISTIARSPGNFALLVEGEGDSRSTDEAADSGGG
jgi:hypothetical protein